MKTEYILAAAAGVGLFLWWKKRGMAASTVIANQAAPVQTVPLRVGDLVAPVPAAQAGRGFFVSGGQTAVSSLTGAPVTDAVGSYYPWP